MLGCARCAEAVRVWLWFRMAPTLENPLPDAHTRNQVFSLGSGSPLAFSRLTPSAGSAGGGFCQPRRKRLFRAMPVISGEREVRDWEGFLTLW